MAPPVAPTLSPAPFQDQRETDRPSVDGKFLRAGGTRLFVKGVTYGTFAPAADGSQFPPPERVRNDFQAMAAAGINTVRVYTPPRPDLLDAAWRAGLRVMVGIPWAQHVAFLADAQLAREARDAVVGAVRRMAEHPAVLLFAIGNEIPPAVVRWHGTRRVETFLNDLLAAARDVAPERLFSYVNFPPTEFLDLSAFDVYAFNVYLHRERDLRAYLARLQQIAGPKPLLLAEAGADSLREGEDGQARITAMHLDAAFSEGCAGAVAFAWTDEWWRGGEAVEDWRFGLVDADRRPKAALAAVAKSFAAAPFAEAARATWPRVSVVVCAYNAADTIGECLGSLDALTYPDFEILLVNDGSTDGTGDLGRRFDRVRVIDIPNGGLSAARNVGLHEATGEIVAYTDADVRVDRDWLTYLVQPFLTSDVVGSGGPNIVPDDDPWMAQCVARSPGGPTQVLLDDRIAEHVPGCNMAFRREALLAVGGFNPLYVKAGDDVDLCWRLQARGWKIGFSPAALVWHHHRATMKAYWRQQVGYGEGEAWLMHEHPDKFAGRHMMWHGRIYSALPFVRRLTRARLNTGPWGLAAFPSVYHTAADPLAYLPHGAGWQFVSLLACLLGLALWFASGLTSAGMLLCLAGLTGIGTTVQRSVACALATALPRRSGAPRRGHAGLVTRAMIAWLHIVQPWARLRGRILGHVHPPRPAEGIVRVTARPRPGLRDVLWTLRMFAGTQAEYRFWNERWHSGEDLLHRLTHNLRSARLAKRLEIDDGWRQHRDVAVALGEWAAVDLSALVEEHAQGRVLVRMRLGLGLGWPAVGAALATLMVIVLSVSPVVSSRWPVATAVALLSGVVSLLLAAWRTAGMLVGVRTSVSRTLSQMGAQAMDGGRSTWRVSPEVPQLRYAGRVALTTVLVGGIGLGGAGLVNDAREGLSSWRRSTEGDAHTAALTTARAGRRTPSVGLAVAPNGDLYLADGDADVIRRVSGTGGVATLPPGTLLRSLRPGALPAGVTKAPAWRLDRPNGVAVSRAGDLYVADAENHQVYRVDRVTGATMVVAGVGRAGSGGDGGRAVDALLDSPTAVAVDRAGNVIIADAGNNRIRRVRATDGAIDTIAGGGTAAAAGEVGDGLKGTQAVLAWPSDVAVAPSGDLYIADTGHNRVRRLEAKRGVITTVAGNGLTGASGDGGPATRASLAAPTGLALVVRRGQTTLYVADASNGRVRVVAPDGTITSLAVPPGLGVEQPARLAYDPRGWLYVADAAPDRLTVLPLAGGRARAVPLTPSGSVARTPRVM